MSASLENLAEAVTGGGVLYSDKFARRRYSDSSSGLTAAERMQRSRVRSNPERMNDSDKRIYNSLGDTSGSKGKVTVFYLHKLVRLCLELKTERARSVNCWEF